MRKVAGTRLQDRTLREQYRLEPMRLDDLDDVVAIEQASFSNPWPQEAFVEEVRKNDFSYPAVASTRALRARVVCGYLVPWVVFEELHIQNVAVHPRHRGRGLGRWLVEEALALGTRRRCRVALLEVRESNTVARQLYASMGFREEGKRRRYYSQPQENAIVYRKILPRQG